jgi:glycosyltransferase involved in cell wall biosynthesis
VTCSSRHRVCILCCVHKWYDTRVYHKMAVSLAENGYDVTVVAPGETEVDKKNGKYLRIKCFLRHYGIFGRIRNMAKAFQIAKNEKFVLLQACEVESWFVGLVLKAFQPKTKVVFDVHEVYSHCYADRLPGILRYPVASVIRFVFHVCSLFTDLIVFAKSGVSLDFKYANDKVTHVLNYVQKSRIKQAAMSKIIHPKKYFAIHIGGFSKERGWVQLLKALKLSKNENINVLILGKIQEGADTLYNTAKAMGVESRITIVEEVPYDEVFAYLQEAYVGLMLYQPGFVNHTYAFPLKLFDYMAAGLYVIAPRFSVEIVPIVKSVENGLLIDVSNPKEIAEALNKIYYDLDSFAQRGIKGRLAVKQYYNWESEFSKLNTAYQKLLDIYE